LGTEESRGDGNMKVLYVGHYKEAGGWANAAKGLMLALDSVGVDVVCRNVTLTRDMHVSEKIRELEKKDTNNVDFCIQNVLPHHLVGSSKFKKNIAYHLLESTNLKYNSWMLNLKHMDEVWVPCEDNKKELISSGLEVVKSIPLAFDLSLYNKQTDDKSFNFKAYGAENAYKFYTIANLNRRKNIESILRSYYSAFHPQDDVVLILKINKHGYSKAETFEYINHICKSVRNSMGIYEEHEHYNNIIVMVDPMQDQEILNLHQSCDCFVNLSHGEAWSIPSFEAMCFGNHPICVNWGGPREYIQMSNKNTGWLVNYCWQTCSNQDAAFSNIFRGNEFWVYPDEKEAAEAMRYYYGNRYLPKNNDGLLCAEKFGLNKVGNKIKEMLET
jgi:glycosyltransferase involved in cell wall biosynthesis